MDPPIPEIYFQIKVLCVSISMGLVAQDDLFNVEIAYNPYNWHFWTGKGNGNYHIIKIVDTMDAALDVLVIYK